MKTMTVQVKFNAEKYSALLRYANKKEISVEAELADTIDKLYKKLVPTGVRDFIEETECSEQAGKESKVKKKLTVSAIDKEAEPEEKR